MLFIGGKTPNLYTLTAMSANYQNAQLYQKVAQEALVQCHRIYSGQQAQFTVMIENIITTLDVREILTPNGLSLIMGENYMGNASVRAAILCYEATFFARLGDRHALLAGLKETIADSLCHPVPPTSTSEDIFNKSLLAPELREPHATVSEAIDAMSYNRWLVSLLALILWTKPVYVFELDKKGDPTGRVLPADHQGERREHQ